MKWLCWIHHDWDHVAGSVKSPKPGCITWTRFCKRCGLEQDISRMLGCDFLEAERKLKEEVK